MILNPKKFLIFNKVINKKWHTLQNLYMYTLTVETGDFEVEALIWSKK